MEAPTRPQRPRPRQAENRIADEVFAISAEAALENEQIDKAMAATGIVQNLKKEENVVVAPGGGSKSVQWGDSGGRIEDKGQVSGGAA